jgi:hypothetical protein
MGNQRIYSTVPFKAPNMVYVEAVSGILILYLLRKWSCLKTCSECIAPRDAAHKPPNPFRISPINRFNGLCSTKIVRVT